MMHRTVRPLAALGLAAAFALGTSGAVSATADWTTYAFNNQRTGYNPAETTLTTKNVGQLKLKWSTNLGGPSITQPLVASRVATAGGAKDLVYVGTDLGALLALDRLTGAVVWQKQLGAATPCTDQFGVTGTPVLDRGRHLIFATDGRNKLHALDEATGGELAGWPVTVASGPTVNVIWDGLTEAGGSLYVGTAGSCDDGGPYRGRVVRVDIATHAVVNTWFVNGAKGPFGGGVWAAGGLSAEANSSALYAATGNALGTSQSVGFSEHVVQLQPNLAVSASNYPGLVGRDVDFGATPMLYQPPGACPAELAVMNKSGVLLVYDRASIGSGPRQSVQIGDVKLANLGDFIMNPGYDPTLHLIYVNATTNSSAGTYRRGIIALKILGDCSLALAWQHGLPASPAAGDYPSVTPTLANGVVYVMRSNNSGAYAFDAATGAQLWTSGNQIQGGIIAAATVANGQLLISSFGGKLYAFGL